jgi:hypothetical protein
LHGLTSLKNTFQWGGKQQKSFDTLKENISTAPVLALSNIQEPFKIEIDTSGYAMGAILIQYRNPIYYHSETFNQVVVNYPTYDKELYALVQSVKKWKHYLLGKETIIHIDHQPLQYLQAQTKLQQSRHYRWMGFLQQIHFVIKYKKGTSNKVENVGTGADPGFNAQERTNKTLTTGPFGNTCEADEVSPEVEAGVVARLRCLQP